MAAVDAMVDAREPRSRQPIASSLYEHARTLWTTASHRTVREHFDTIEHLAGQRQICEQLEPVAAGQDQRPARSRELFQKLRPLFEVLFIEANPGPIKAALAMAGRMASEVRLPLVPPSEASEARIRGVLNRLGVS